MICFEKKGAQAALVEHKKYLRKTFRIPDKMEDMLDNIDVIPTEVLHHGFW